MVTPSVPDSVNAVLHNSEQVEADQQFRAHTIRAVSALVEIADIGVLNGAMSNELGLLMSGNVDSPDITTIAAIALLIKQVELIGKDEFSG